MSEEHSLSDSPPTKGGLGRAHWLKIPDYFVSGLHMFLVNRWVSALEIMLDDKHHDLDRAH